MRRTISIQEYYAATGSRFTNDDAEKIGPVLAELANEGNVDEQAVVDAARSPNSPLRTYFEWNDEKAANNWRKQQAGEMLQSIRVKVVSTDGQAAHGFAFKIKNINGDGKANVTKWRELKDESAYVASMMFNAMEDIKRWRQRYEPHAKAWNEFAGLFQPVVNQIAEFESEVRNKHFEAILDEAFSKMADLRAYLETHAEDFDRFAEQAGYLIETMQACGVDYKKTAPYQERKCMSCEKDFLSKHKFNRLCERCSQSAGGLEEHAA